MYKVSFAENGISCSNKLTYSTLLGLGVGGGGGGEGTLCQMTSSTQHGGQFFQLIIVAR